MAVTLSELNMGTLFNTTINTLENTTISANEVLGDTTNGGKPVRYTYDTSNSAFTPTTATTGFHLFQAFDADQSDAAASPENAGTIGAAAGSEVAGQIGASIVVRGSTIASGAGSELNDKLLIDESTVNDHDMRSFITHIDNAIGTMNSKLNQIGIDQSSLSGKEVNLSEAITANSAARSRIMDTDFAKEQSNSIRLQILQQTATAALSQANMGPQAVLGFLG
jgi:flagellin